MHPAPRGDSLASIDLLDRQPSRRYFDLHVSTYHEAGVFQPASAQRRIRTSGFGQSLPVPKIFSRCEAVLPFTSGANSSGEARHEAVRTEAAWTVPLSRLATIRSEPAAIPLRLTRVGFGVAWLFAGAESTPFVWVRRCAFLVESLKSR